MSDIDNTSIASPAPVGSLVSRRRLVRAGMAAAPVAMALTSQSVLATDICIKPSAFSSLKAANYALSGGRTPTASFSCFSHGYWSINPHPSPYSILAKSYFLSPAPAGTGNVTAGFTRNFGTFYTGKTLIQVLNLGSNSNDEQFARDIVATFLTAVQAGDINVLLTQAQCRTIWNNDGIWTPPGATSAWNKSQTIAYLKYIYGGVQT
jgi:hypothetical protein